MNELGQFTAILGTILQIWALWGCADLLVLI